MTDDQIMVDKNIICNEQVFVPSYIELRASEILQIVKILLIELTEYVYLLQLGILLYFNFIQS